MLQQLHTRSSINHHLCLVRKQTESSPSLREERCPFRMEVPGVWSDEERGGLLVLWTFSQVVRDKEGSLLTPYIFCQCSRRCQICPLLAILHVQHFLLQLKKQRAEESAHRARQTPYINEIILLILQLVWVPSLLLLWSLSPAWWRLQQTCGCRQTVSPRPCGPRCAPSGKPSHPGGSSPDHRPWLQKQTIKVKVEISARFFRFYILLQRSV